MSSRADRSYRLKVFLAVELFSVLAALVLPLVPGNGSRGLIDLPPDAASYFRSVLVCLALVHGILLAVAAVAWLVLNAERRRSGRQPAGPSGT